MPPPPAIWMPEHFLPDTDLRIQALGSLIRDDAARVIPMLKEIALESGNLGEARRALFVLAQSDRPEARLSVIEVARSGSEPVRIAAVRELGRLGGPSVSNELLQVYYLTANQRVKSEVVSSLGQRDATVALMRIAQTETDQELRNTAIITLGEAGGLEQLRTLYGRAAAGSKRAIIRGLFNARAEEELIRIADREQDAAIRQDVLTKLRLLGTPRAKEYLERTKQK
jgi:HEAT repeat protein